MNNVNSYKLRAECLLDVVDLVSALIKSSISFEYKVESLKMIGGFRYPDCEVEIKTEASLSDLKKAISEIPDCHVMIETLSFKDYYTGER